MSKCSKLFLESSDFRHSDYIMQQNNGCYTCSGDEFLDRFLYWAKHQNEATRWNWVTLTTLCEENTRKMCARWSYPETMKLDSIMKKKYKKVDLELWAESFRVSERPKEMDSNPDHRQKTNIVSGSQRYLDIQKELGWDLVLQGTSARSWVRLPAHPKRIEVSSRRPAKREKPPEKVVCTPKENWNGIQETSMKKSWGLVEVWGRSQLFDLLLLLISDKMSLKTGGWEVER